MSISEAWCWGLGSHFENTTSSGTAGISETLFFYNVGHMTFQKNTSHHGVKPCGLVLIHRFFYHYSSKIWLPSTSHPYFILASLHFLSPLPFPSFPVPNTMLQISTFHNADTEDEHNRSDTQSLSYYEIWQAIDVEQCGFKPCRC